MFFEQVWDQAEIVDNPAIEELVRRLTQVLPVPGPIDVDILHTEGTYYIIDINPRFGGGYPLSHQAGADFPGIIAAILSGRSPESFLNKRRVGTIAMKEYSFITGRPEQLTANLSAVEPPVLMTHQECRA